MKNRAEIVKYRAVGGPYYYTDREGNKVMHLPTTITDNVKAIDNDGTRGVSLKDIIAEQFVMMEAQLKKDICNLYVSTRGLHGNTFELSGNTKMITIKDHRKNIKVTAEVDSNLPYVEI